MAKISERMMQTETYKNTSPKRQLESVMGSLLPMLVPVATVKTMSTGFRLAFCGGKSICHAVTLCDVVLPCVGWLEKVVDKPVLWSLKVACMVE